MNNSVKEIINQAVKSKDTMKRAELLARGCIQFFSFNRVSIFTYSPMNYISEGLVIIEQNKVASMNWIKEDVRTIPPVYHSLSNKKIVFVDLLKKRNQFPEIYIKHFNLTTLAVIPILHNHTVVGCVIADRFCGENINFMSEVERLSHYIQEFVKAILTDKRKNILSKREIEVLQFLANGYSMKEMAHIMKISEYTVRDYLSAVNRKLGVNHRAEAVAVGIRRGIIC